MTIGSALARLAVTLAIAGILMLPFARMGMAVPAADPAMHAQSMTPDDVGMPCCPPKAPQSDCGKDCPLAGLCTASWLEPAALGDGLTIPLQRTTLMVPGGDRDLDSLAQRPPPRPPKT